MTETCIWSQDDEGSEMWSTSCRKYFGQTEGTPGENGMKFCCYCGKPLTQQPWAQNEENNDDHTNP